MTNDAHQPPSSVDVWRLLGQLPIGIAVYDPELALVYANDQALEILRISRDDMEHRRVQSDWVLLDRHGHELAFDQYPVSLALAQEEPITNMEVGVPMEDGGVRWCLCNAFREYDTQRKVLGAVVCFTDITERREAIPFKDIVEQANDIVLVTRASPLRNGGPEIVYANRAFERVTQFQLEEIVGRTPRMLQGPDTDAAARERIYAALAEGTGVKEELVNFRKDGTPYWVELNIVPLRDDDDQLRYFAAIERDITLSKDVEAQLVLDATTDPLTQLLNRRGAMQSMELALQRSVGDARRLALIMLDVDHFKRLNDQLGHDAGDKALIHLATLLRRVFRRDDVIGRLGGEEFCVLMSAPPPETLVEKLNRVLQTVATTPWKTDDDETYAITVSMGCALWDGNSSEDLGSLIKRADKALYEAKGAGRNCVVIDHSKSPGA